MEIVAEFEATGLRFETVEAGQGMVLILLITLRDMQRQALWRGHPSSTINDVRPEAGSVSWCNRPA